MKKRERATSKDNVIFFPELDKRLTEKGLESLQMKKFNEAIVLLNDAKEMDPENGDILIGLVIAYFEAGRLKEAEELCKGMLNRGIGDYYQMVDLYLTILIQLHEYGEIVSTLEALMEEREIPAERKNHFLTILQFSKRMVENPPNIMINEREKILQQQEEQLQELNLFSLQDPREQLLLVSKLANENVRPYIEDIKAYMISEEGHPFLKTMLLNILKEQEYDKVIVVVKFGKEENFIPSDLPDLYSQTEMKSITQQLSDQLEHHDPVLFENVKSLVERYFFSSYPFPLDPAETRAWAAAFHLTALDYHGMDKSLDEISEKYSVTLSQIELAIGRIKEFEEISYPII
ncbi:MAG: tetratricopeptide repeat protein [Bacillota bacterium]|nr:tetratricopeptide repeat protein [Bacillota bacterium]